jgi:hypothetical protein
MTQRSRFISIYRHIRPTSTYQSCSSALAMGFNAGIQHQPLPMLVGVTCRFGPSDVCRRAWTWRQWRQQVASGSCAPWWYCLLLLYLRLIGPRPLRSHPVLSKRHVRKAVEPFQTCQAACMVPQMIISACGWRDSPFGVCPLQQLHDPHVGKSLHWPGRLHPTTPPPTTSSRILPQYK